MHNSSSIQYAGFFSRLSVFLVDLLILSFLLYILTRIFGEEGGRIGLIVAAWLYWAISLNRWRTTPGGKLLGIEICAADGSPLSFAKASIRFFVSIAPFVIYMGWRGMQHSAIPAPSPTMQMLPQLVYLLPPFLIFFTAKRQMIHDIVSDSIVLDLTTRSADKGERGIHAVSLGRKIVRIVVIGAFLLVFGYVLIYTSVFFMLGKHQQDAYNASFHSIYPVDDRNDSTIAFYHRELERTSKAFIEANDMYGIFEADVKRDFAVDCIESLLQADHNVSEWIEEGSRFRKNARNKYADTEEKISKAKANEAYLGRHFYDYDFNDVNSIMRKLVDPFDGNNGENNRTCRKRMSVDALYGEFIYRYIANREEALAYNIWEEKYAKTSGLLNKSFYQGRIRQIKSWLKILYEKHPGYGEYKARQKRLAEQKEKMRKQKSEEKVKTDKEKALWTSATEGSGYPMYYLKGVNADIRNEEGLTPLMVAVKNGYSSVINTWAMDGVRADVWAKDPEGKTAWDYIKKPTSRYEAIFSNRMYMALRMLEIHQIVGNKARIVQSMSGIDRVKIWIEGASCYDFYFPKYVQCIESPKIDRSGSRDTVYEKDIKRGVPPLFAAIQNHQHEKLEALLRSGEDVEQKNKFGTRPLSFAVNHQDIKSVKLLLEYGANPNVMDGYGEYTPLSAASMRNQIETVKLLLDYGADVNYQYNKSETALTVAAKGCKNLGMVKLLLDYGADPKIKDEFGYDTISGLSRYCRDKDAYREMKAVIESSVQ